MSMKILFVGSNPSIKSQSNEAFMLDTASGRILRTWTEGIEGTFCYENILSLKTEGNRPLNKTEMAHALASLGERIALINPDRLVSLGLNASHALSKLKLSFLEMPHPSGLNRKLNDSKYREEKIRSLRSYCSRDGSTVLQNM